MIFSQALVGGFSLGLERTGGFETVAFCEIDPFCRQVLAKHWPDVSIFEDVRQLTSDAIGSVDIITGGYPCQPFSFAGKRTGEADDRHLWPEMHRLVAALRPAWVIGENVFGHVSMGLDQVLSDLETLDYAWRPFVIPACAVDAPHRRDRVWIVAHSDTGQRDGEKQEICAGRVAFEHGGRANAYDDGWTGRKKPITEPAKHQELHQSDRRICSSLADAASNLRRTPRDEGPSSSNGSGPVISDDGCRGGEGSRASQRGWAEPAWWLTEPNVGGTFDGLPARIHGGLDGIDEMGGTETGTKGDTNAGRAPSNKKDEIVQSLRHGIHSEPFQETQHLQQEMSVGDRSAKRNEAMAWRGDWERGVPRVATGVPNRVDRLKSLGNAVVPQIPEMIGRAILATVRVRAA